MLSANSSICVRLHRITFKLIGTQWQVRLACPQCIQGHASTIASAYVTIAKAQPDSWPEMLEHVLIWYSDADFLRTAEKVLQNQPT